MVEERQKRQVAYTVPIEDILTGQYFKMEGWDPNYVLTPFGLKVSRVTLMGTVLNKNENQIEIDDSTGIITIRSFESFPAFDSLNTKDFVLIIGRVREFANEIYISPESCKIVDKRYMSMHKSNIALIKKYFKEEKIKQEEKEVVVNLGSEKEVVSEEVRENPTEKVLAYIEEKDKGEGVHRQEIISYFEDIEIGTIFEKLINDGDIFEVTSDVFKVLK